MIMTWPMLTMGIIAAALQIGAHLLMYGDGDVQRNLIARYTAGTAIIGLCFSGGIALDNRANPITGFWYVAGCSGVAVWACWEWRRVQRMRVAAVDVEWLANYIGAEHSEDEPDAGD